MGLGVGIGVGPAHVHPATGLVLPGLDHLVADWQLLEGAGQVTADASGHGYDLQLGSTAGVDTNDPTWEAFGTLHSSDDYLLRTATEAALIPPAFTLAAICDPVGASSLITSWNVASIQNGFYANFNGNGALLYFSGDLYRYWPAVDAGAWHTVVLTCPSRDVAGLVASQLWVDGVEATPGAQAATGAPVATGDFSLGGNAKTGCAIHLARVIEFNAALSSDAAAIAAYLRQWGEARKGLPFPT